MLAPDGVCPEERPAAIERSGVLAVVDPASRHATASVAAVQQAVSTHPVSASGIRLSSRPVSGHLGSSSGCPAVRSSAVHPSSLQPAGVRPVGLDASVFSRTERWRWPRSVRRAPLTTGTSQVLVGCRAVERLGRRPSSLDAGGATELACWSAGVSVADPAGLGGAARAR